MSDSVNTKTTLRAWLVLPLLALIAALLLTATYLCTQTRIANNRQHAADAVMLDALTLPANTVLTPTNTSLTPPSGDDRQLLTLLEPRQIYLARRGGQIIALIVPVTAHNGYNGIIELLIGIAPDGAIVGVSTVKHRETAGLGDRIDADKSDWIKQFVGKSLRTVPTERWMVKNSNGDFDQITGATVTSRAVIDAVSRALQYFESHREQLLSGADSSATAEGGNRHE